jgi:CheY-specific phosphatase CheX
MKEALTTAVMTSISEVMETMFFLPVEYVQDATLVQSKMDKEENLACRLSFSGDISGHLILLGNESLVEEMAQNFMGESLEQITEQNLAETLKEMLNMVCGSALSKIHSSVPFELGIPETLDDSDIPLKEVCSIIETTQAKMAFCLKTD